MDPIAYISEAMGAAEYDEDLYDEWSDVERSDLEMTDELENGADDDAALKALPLPTVQDIAKVLGFLPGGRTMSVQERLHEVKNVLVRRLDIEEYSLRIVVYSGFAAEYMPKLVEAYISQPQPYPGDDAENAYSAMLLALHDNEYFIKYLLSTRHTAEMGNKLSACVAERFLAAAPAIDEYLTAETWRLIISSRRESTPAARLCQLLSIVLILQVEKASARAIPGHIMRPLLVYLDKWSRMRGTTTGEAAQHLAQLLRKEPFWIADARKMRDIMRGIGACAPMSKLFCHASSLSPCPRCKTVVYCGAEHQALDWPTHKLVCHQTTY